MSKCLKIICCYFGPRRKHFNTPPNIIEYVKDSVKNEIEMDNGFDTDVVYVNNDNGNIDSNEILNSYHNTKTKNGKIFVETRPNHNGSFGAYYDMFFKYKDDYDYFFFCEDDVIVYKEKYIKEFIDFINENENVGFVCLAPIAGSKYPPHSGGGCGLTTKEKFIISNIKENVEKFMEINNQHNCSDYQKLQFLEVEFTNSFVRSGYELKNHPKFSPLCINYNSHQGQKSNLQEGYLNLEFIYKVGL
jgi:hypothetical protein